MWFDETGNVKQCYYLVSFWENGRIIGAYNRDDYFTCEKCGKVFKAWQLDYDYLAVNRETGWIFPMNRRKFE